MQDDGELACDCGPGIFDAVTFGESHTPCFHRRPSLHDAETNARRFKQV
jgi:hypothetical protein